MNDIRRNILWVIFGVSLVMLWDNWQVYNGKPATFFPQASQLSAPAQDAGKASPAAPALPSPASVPGAAGVAPAAAQPAAAAAVPRERIDVRTDVLQLSFDTEGGSVVRSEFLKYADSSDAKQNFVLLNDSKDRFYKAQSGVLGTSAGQSFPTHVTPMAFSGERALKDGQDSLEVRFTSPDVGGLKLVKTYTLRRGAYDIEVKHELVNTSANPISAQLYVQLVRDGNKPPGESAFYSTFTGPAVYTDTRKFEKVEFADLKKDKDAKRSTDIQKSSDNGYVAMVQHYFTSAWLLPHGVPRENAAMAFDPEETKVPDCCYRVTSVAPMDAIQPGQSKVVQAKLFIGPQEEKLLESLAPGLELVKDYGYFTILAKPLYWLLDKLHSVLQNWGWSIVALVVVLKIAFYWLNAKAYASMAKMKAVNPRIVELRERLKDKPQQMQQEMMRIYREEKVNPMGGCFPIMVQIPVFIALYWVLLSSVEMRNAPWMAWIQDLSAPDPFYILPLVMTLTTLLQTALNPAPPDPMQAKMMWFMPLAFSVMFFFFPSGLVLYWITNNVLSIAQQWVINTRLGVPPQFNLPKFK